MPDCRIDHLHVARKTSCEEPCFGWLESVTTGPLFALAGYTVPGRSGLIAELCEIELVSCASNIDFDGPRKLGAG
jgi:hypothetical protein